MSTNERVTDCGFHHVAIRARDFDKSVGFYTDVMGFRRKIGWGQKPGRAVMLDVGDGNYLEIFERPEQAPRRQSRSRRFYMWRFAPATRPAHWNGRGRPDAR